MTNLAELNRSNVSSDDEAVAVIVRHLLSQKETCNGPNGDCAYRGMTENIYDEQYEVIEYGVYNGKSCAVGCLIKEQFYDGNIEGETATNELVQELLKKSHPNWQFSANTTWILTLLQKIHDKVIADHWVYVLRQFVIYYKSPILEAKIDPDDALDWLKARAFDRVTATNVSYDNEENFVLNRINEILQKKES
jgi:adenine specific DNA methylase Mod